MNKTLEDVLHAGWDVGVAWQDGRMFHHPCAILMNLALLRALVEGSFQPPERLRICVRLWKIVNVLAAV